MKYEVKHLAELGGWVVEAIRQSGEIEIAQFYGVDDARRAGEYAEWKNSTK